MGVIRLGTRLATSGGRASALAIGLTAGAVALGTAILLFALSFSPAVDDRLRRTAWREAPVTPPERPTLLIQVFEDRFRDRPLIRVHVARLTADVAPPPGTERLPAPGEAVVSPALARTMTQIPPGELAERVGTVVGLIGDASLRSPDELVAIVGMDPAALREAGALELASFRSEPKLPAVPPIMILMIVLAVAGAMAPVAVFVGTATRLSAARREQRLAALRLVGATPRQVRQLAIVEALIPTLIGTLAGVALFFALRPLVALVPLDQATWWPASIAPPLGPAVVLVALVPVVGALAAIASLRRVVVTPLGVQRRQTPQRPSIVRLLPLIVSVGVLVVTIVTLRGGAVDSLAGIAVVGGSFAGIIGGMAIAGPWLTAGVGRVLYRVPGGASTLLVSRRLTDDPRGSFGSIAGVVMAVFVASAFFTFVGFANAQARFSDTERAETGMMHLTLPQLGGPPADALLERLANAEGVNAFTAVATAEVFGAGDVPLQAWVVACRTLAESPDAPFAPCADRPVHRLPFTSLPPGEYRVVGERAVRGDRPSVAVTIGDRDVHEVTWEDLDETSPLGAPEVVIEPTAFGGAVAGFQVSAVTLWTDGTSATEDRVRTAVARDFPTAYLNVVGRVVAREPIFEEFGRVVQLGLFGSLLLAGCSLAVAVTTAIVERRREYALLRSAGMPASRLRSIVMLQAGVPLIAVATFSALLGIVVAQVVLGFASGPDAVIPVPDASLALTLAASIAAALGIVALTLPPLERLTRPETVRME
jgi:hypothetical protein